MDSSRGQRRRGEEKREELRGALSDADVVEQEAQAEHRDGAERGGRGHRHAPCKRDVPERTPLHRVARPEPAHAHHTAHLRECTAPNEHVDM